MPPKMRSTSGTIAPIYVARVYGNVIVTRWQHVGSMSDNELFMRDLERLREDAEPGPVIAVGIVAAAAEPPWGMALTGIDQYRDRFFELLDDVRLVMDLRDEIDLAVARGRVRNLIDFWLRQSLSAGAYSRFGLAASLTEALDEATVASRWPAAQVVAAARADGLITATSGPDSLEGTGSG